MGKKIKRKKSEVIWITMWLALSVIWISFLIHLTIVYGLDLSKDTIAIALFSNVPTAIFLSALFIMLKDKVYLGIIEFHIHKYDRWNHKDSKYETLYITEQVNKYANFIYYKNVGTITNKWSQSDIEEYCSNLPGSYDDFVGYKTQEEAMKEILQKVKDIIKWEKSEVHIKIKNIGTVQTLTYEELVEMVDVMFVTIADNCPKEYWYSGFAGRKFKVKQCVASDMNVEGFEHKDPNNCVWVNDEHDDHFGSLIDMDHTVKE
jgi:hypothetical protein